MFAYDFGKRKNPCGDCWDGRCTMNCGPSIMQMTLHCIKCGGEGRIFKSKYGGNDPDVWDAGQCEACEGSGHQTCDTRSCKEKAVGFNDDGEALCEDCLAAWACEFSDD